MGVPGGCHCTAAGAGEGVRIPKVAPRGVSGTRACTQGLVPGLLWGLWGQTRGWDSRPFRWGPSLYRWRSVTFPRSLLRRCGPAGQCGPEGHGRAPARRDGGWQAEGFQGRGGFSVSSQHLLATSPGLGEGDATISETAVGPESTHFSV